MIEKAKGIVLKGEDAKKFAAIAFGFQSWFADEKVDEKYVEKANYFQLTEGDFQNFRQMCDYFSQWKLECELLESSSISQCASRLAKSRSRKGAK